MHHLTIHPPSQPGFPDRICISDCDKDGSIVAARLASALDAVSSGRPLAIRPDRFTDGSYFADIGNTLAGYYRLADNSRLLDTETVVLSSVHRAALYVAEALHAPLLPLQILSFARNLEEAALSPVLSILGSDHGVDYLWQWNKIASVSHFPQAYIDMIQKASHAVVVRSTDKGDDCPVEGRIGNLFVNRTVRRLNPQLWNILKDKLTGTGYAYNDLCQWEWGLPDHTVAAAKLLWESLGKPLDRFHVIEADTIQLYKNIPFLWEEYLRSNSVPVRGVTLNAYWTAHPCYERKAGLIPVHFYRFALIKETAELFLRKYQPGEDVMGRLFAFINNVGGASDCEEICGLISDMGLQDLFWACIGFDSPDAQSRDVFGELVPGPCEKVAELIADAPYGFHNFRPMDPGAVCETMTRTSAPV